MTASTERERLVQAIKHARERERITEKIRLFYPNAYIELSELGHLVAAAEKHLQSLPKPVKKWSVSVSGGNVYKLRHFDSFDQAMIALRIEASNGWPVTIEYRSTE